MKQHVLVLGADEFIGRQVIALLRSSGWAEPIAGVRREMPKVEGAHRQVVVRPMQTESVAAALCGMSAVVNCATLKPAHIMPAMRALVQAVHACCRPIRIAHLSSMSVYGSATGDVDEDAPLRGDLGAYSAAKVGAEKVVREYSHAVVFRQGCIYGPSSPQWSVRFARYLRAGRLGDLGPAGDGFCNLVHVDDVALAVLGALQNPDTDGCVYNLSTPVPPTWNEYLSRFARALRAVPVRRISHRRLRFEAKVAAAPLKLAEKLAGAVGMAPGTLPPPLPPSLQRLMSQDIRLRTARIERDLGMRWMDLELGLQQTAAALSAPGQT